MRLRDAFAVVLTCWLCYFRFDKRESQSIACLISPPSVSPFEVEDEMGMSIHITSTESLVCLIHTRVDVRIGMCLPDDAETQAAEWSMEHPPSVSTGPASLPAHAQLIAEPIIPQHHSHASTLCTYPFRAYSVLCMWWCYTSCWGQTSDGW